MIVSGTYIILTIQNDELQKAESELKSFSSLIEGQIINQYESELDFQVALDEFLKREISVSSMYGSIINKNGRTIASSIITENETVYQHKTSDVILALTGHENFNSFQQNIDEFFDVSEWITYAYPIFDDKEVKYVIYTQMNANSIRNTLLKTTNSIIIAVFIALILAITLGGLLATTITAPIVLLTKKANLLAKGNLEQYISVKGEDEIGQLTRSFNHMARELRKTMLEIENENNKLEIVLNNMTDGVIAFDEIGTVMQVNKEFYELMNLDELYTPMDLDYFLKKININKKQIKLNENTEITINENGKYISVVLLPYTDKNNFVEGLMVVLKDITQHKKLDDMRKEFVANVSHEIRTPITTIKSYTETLIDGAIDEKEIAMDFLNTINEATDRMKFLTDDLLELSKIDGGKLTLTLKPINLYSVVISCIKQNVILAKNKNQNIVLFQPKTDNMKIFADVERINQVINNILSNAIKYSYENTKIEVSLNEVDSKYILKIKDQGMGIPKEDLGRIFERFYRVDKARSRAMGGNGLGLSIAKEIMIEHKGDINAYSRMGEGTTMEIIFRKYKKN